MSVIHRVKSALSRVMVRVGRERLRRELLTLSDRMLLDAGFSPELVKAGSSAWPWRLEQAHTVRPNLRAIGTAPVTAQPQTAAPSSRHAQAA